MTPTNDSPRNDRHEHDASGLARRTLRTAGLLVAACVLFVGLLSAVAVSIASRAVSATSGASSTQAGANEPAKKPLSI